MKEESIEILVSNDDGFRTQGIRELTEALRPLGNVTVVAPDGPRSGASAAITSTLP
ncbi:5'/3'-nucleotidase SurE, partial [Porphyromonas loveana]|uniref:5'/3'-nucleotidase SurE n=1 Tax=Porphyromonas loveana TaxID=1884669 RepID=UPI0035A0EE13